jgi:hypothetical protein
VVVDRRHGRGLDADLGPVALQLLGEEHRQGREHALAHLGLSHEQRHALVTPDAHEGLGRVRGRLGRLRQGAPRGLGQRERDHQAAAAERPGAQEAPPIQGSPRQHHRPPASPLPAEREGEACAARRIALRMRG